MIAANKQASDQPNSMNEVTERDPFNNSSYGTLVDTPYKPARFPLPVLDVNTFNDTGIRGYEEGDGEKALPAALRWPGPWLPPATRSLRDSSTVGPRLPCMIPANGTARPKRR